ncbi:MAG: peptide chain release factor N(5)-glutamine methyltransferase [Amoebophilaceae bacterium]|nr:peptide chain release factor N(5)-glutamine methyltransferase [Amoebophilaceae bacterium]
MNFLFKEDTSLEDLGEVVSPLKDLRASLEESLSLTIKDSREIRAIVKEILHHYFQVEATDYILNPLLTITSVMHSKLYHLLYRLKADEPIQYILEEAFFAGHTFKVTPAVLIPRPETAAWVACLRQKIAPPDTILDIGTGSGCIAIILKKYFPAAAVDAIDISEEALKVADYNASQLGVTVNFIKKDILTESLPPRNWSLMVSNPPYVRIAEKQHMRANVLLYEPHVALFVDNDNPLLFYKRIANLAGYHLNANGTLCMEINEALGEEVEELLHDANFKQVALYNDIHEKKRWVMARF